MARRRARGVRRGPSHSAARCSSSGGELAADDADGVGGDAGVEAARAGYVGHDLCVEEVLDGGQELVVSGSVLHQAVSIRFESSHSVSAVRRPMAASSTDFDMPSR